MINVNFEFFTETNKPIFMTTGDDRVPLTFLDAAVNALLYPPTDVVSSVAEKRMRYDTAVQMKNFKEKVELSEQQKQLLIQAIGQRFIPIVVGQACDILDGKEPPKF